ncbi:MarR family transcriptional regulator [Pokkaliibacter plantistimulans]|uniref:MarR family transcriptional regulator n=1 Tax=Proteobacteria bacterium 228 TaxID=2083153 RepID=A0A2S5KPK6_9PROT|nr:MarR family transcriptional regulator [Pokkaliibacter plantistimulans]PPC76670.1 MarR family transcriptional regulator [Pokkaliibacter plantistimulans]
MSETRKKRQHRYDPASEEFQKEEFPFYWLARVHGRYSLAMEKALKKAGVDIPRWRILFILKEEGHSSISEIAEHAIAKLPTITKIVYRMKADGLVDTQTSAEDGRVTVVSLTEAGWSTITRIQEVTSALFRQSFKGMSEAQINRLNTMLETIFNNLPEH